VTEFRQEEKISRQRAAERLIDIAYALTAGGTLELRNAGQQVSVPVADEVLLKRESNAHGGRVTVEVELTWRA
jgi:amphi-Trp domain-containing protein